MIVLGILCLIIMVFMLLNYRYKNSFYYQNLVEFENRPVRKIYWSDKIKMVNLGSVHARFAFQYFKNEELVWPVHHNLYIMIFSYWKIIRSIFHEIQLWLLFSYLFICFKKLYIIESNCKVLL